MASCLPACWRPKRAEATCPLGLPATCFPVSLSRSATPERLRRLGGPGPFRTLRASATLTELCQRARLPHLFCQSRGLGWPWGSRARAPSPRDSAGDCRTGEGGLGQRPRWWRILSRAGMTGAELSVGRVCHLGKDILGPWQGD